MAKKLVQYLGTGRRKSSVARVYLRAGKGTITINGRAFEDYIPSAAVRLDVLQPLQLTETAEKFDVSYQQVRSWVLKVDQNGFEALQDGRGRKKSRDELSEMDKVLLENKRLKAELKAQEAQTKFAKKFLENLRKGR